MRGHVQLRGLVGDLRLHLAAALLRTPVEPAEPAAQGLGVHTPVRGLGAGAGAEIFGVRLGSPLSVTRSGSSTSAAASGTRSWVSGPMA